MNPLVRHSKKDAKFQKMTLKQQSSVFSRKEAERELKNLEQEKSQSQYQDPIIKRAMRQWRRIDEKYFQTVTIEQAINKRRICTSQQVLELGGFETSYLLNYREQMVYSSFPILADKNKIRVLFKYNNQPYCGIGIYGLDTAIPNYNSDNRQSLQESGIKVTTKCSKQYRSIEEQNQNQKIQNMNNQLKSIKLDLEDYEEKQSICERISKIDEIDSNMFYLHEIDKQIALWEWQLQIANKVNNQNWNKLIQRLKIDDTQLKARDVSQFDLKIMKYRDKLYWSTVLRSFQHGFKDKTKKMLEAYIENEKNFNSRPPKGLTGHGSKKFFQTDCKICFSSDNSDSNQVLYCDSCNTSFHLACYGLTSVPQEEQYFCERCTYLKKQQVILGAKTKKPYCQICFKISFPMKKIQDHLYHVTCLVMFNFVQFQNNKMVLKGSLTHQNIMKMVIQNQLMHDQCNYCRKIGGGTQLGMQIKCSYEGCQNYCHPICAYLNGCKFELKATNTKSLNVKMFCNDHLGDRTQQVYLRRYMCNLNQTSSKSYQDFIQIFEKDQQSLINSKQVIMRNKKKYPNRILMLTKFVKSLFKSRMEREQQPIMTQTQNILNKLKKNTA